MPKIALDSILKSTSETILIGYTNEADVVDLPTSPRINYVDLGVLQSIEGIEPSTEYVDFSKQNFYKLVQYKWVLLKYAKKQPFKTIIFSDFDVYWNKSPVSDLNETFSSFSEINIQIQTYTSKSSHEQLCMGFIALRNNSSIDNLIQHLSDLHARALLHNQFTGDDNIISEVYNSDVNFRSQCRLLPQSTFPTGNLINAYARKNLFPGLIPYEPYIFHANFVVGSKRKIQLLRTFVFKSQFGSPSIYQRIMVGFHLTIRRIGVYVRKLSD